MKEKMTRETMLTFTHGLIEGYKADIQQVIKEGVFSDGDYTWQEYLADYTGIELDSEEDITLLSDAQLQQIVDTYI